MSQNQPNVTLFSLGQDYVAIDKLLALRTGFGTLESQWEHESMLTRTHARLWRQESDQKSVQVLIVISPNTLRACSGNHCVKAIRTKKTRAFRSDSSRTIPVLTCNNPKHNTSEIEELTAKIEVLRVATEKG
jgi:hypothetical protein